MDTELVTVATFQFAGEAETSKLRFQMEGLTPFLADREMVVTDWFLGNSVGYIKLQVPRSQVETAARLLELMKQERQRVRGQSIEDLCLSCHVPFPAEADQCPACGWSFADDSESAPDDDE